MDISPSLVPAGAASALQLTEGRTELTPLATTGYFSPLILHYSHNTGPSKDQEGFFLPVYLHPTPPTSAQPQKEPFPSPLASQVALAQPRWLCKGKKGPERPVRLLAAQLRQQNSMAWKYLQGSIPHPNTSCRQRAFCTGATAPLAHL